MSGKSAAITGQRHFLPRVTPSHPVPIKRQLAAGLECAIRDRLLEPGAVLPPTRVLAGRLGVHRHTVTAAYRLLRDRGLIAGALGAPVRVPSTAVPPRFEAAGPGVVGSAGSHPVAAARLVREMASRARHEGVSRHELARQVATWSASGRARRLCLVEPRPGLRAVLQAELCGHLSTPVGACDWRGLRTEPTRTGGGSTDGALILARPEIVDRIEGQLPGRHVLQPIVLAGGSSALASARAMRRPGVVALLTRSSLIRRFARDLAAGYHASGLSVALPDPGDLVALSRAARIARLILVDASCRGVPLETRAPVHLLQVVSEPTIRALQWHLGGQTRRQEAR